MYVCVCWQSLIDIFFIDWERPQGKVVTLGSSGSDCARDVPVSVWRTYFVANEWNEIQTVRQINPVFQYFAVVFFLSVVGFGNTATMDPVNDFHTSHDEVVYRAPMSNILRFACICVVYLVVGSLSTCSLQWYVVIECNLEFVKCSRQTIQMWSDSTESAEHKSGSNEFYIHVAGTAEKVHSAKSEITAGLEKADQMKTSLARLDNVPRDGFASMEVTVSVWPQFSL